MCVCVYMRCVCVYDHLLLIFFRLYFVNLGGKCFLVVLDTWKVTRGGSFGTEIYYLRSANRLGSLPDDSNSWGNYNNTCQYALN